MKPHEYTGGENFDLHDILLLGRELRLTERAEFFAQFIDDLSTNNKFVYRRCINGVMGREVTIINEENNTSKSFIMFGSNNYLGLADHPYVKARVKAAVDTYGIGVGGPPLLNGYTTLHRELESRISAFKGREDTLIFSSGYSTNVGLLTALYNKHDIVLYDKYSHASLIDGLRMCKAKAFPFCHNDISDLDRLLKEHRYCKGNVYVAVEGVYSMDGDLAKLDEIVPLCKEYGAVIMLDDAHGTGVLGEHGKGTAEHFGVQDDVDIIVGTFSKAFGVVGGFISASKEIVNYLRFFARSYMFSASLPPPVVAAVLAGIDVLENEPDLFHSLHNNIAYTKQLLREIGFNITTVTPIIAIIVPEVMDIRKAAYQFHKKGIFVNAIEYPAVPVHLQRFRISLMATHTRTDIETLVGCIDDVWCTQGCTVRKIQAES
jgi:glycine C-acetyltransferase